MNRKMIVRYVMLIGALIGAAGMALAQSHSMSGGHATGAAHASGAAHSASEMMTAGEIRRVDPVQGKLTIRHEEIKSIMMPPMTMVFTVQDPQQMQELKVGDKVLFEVVDQAGRLTITKIRKAP